MHRQEGELLKTLNNAVKESALRARRAKLRGPSRQTTAGLSVSDPSRNADGTYITDKEDAKADTLPSLHERRISQREPGTPTTPGDAEHLSQYLFDDQTKPRSPLLADPSRRRSRGGRRTPGSVSPRSDSLRPPTETTVATPHVFVLNSEWKDEPFIPKEERTLRMQNYSSQAKPSKLYEFTRTKIPSALPQVQVPRPPQTARSSKPGTADTSTGPSSARVPAKPSPTHLESEGNRAKVAVGNYRSTVFHFGRWRDEQRAAQASLIEGGSDAQKTKERQERVKAKAMQLVSVDNEDDIQRDVRWQPPTDDGNAFEKDPVYLESLEAAHNFEQFLLHKQVEHTHFIDRSMAEIRRLFDASSNFIVPRKRTAIISQSDAGKGFLECSRKANSSLKKDIAEHQFLKNLKYSQEWFAKLKERVLAVMAPPTTIAVELFAKFEPYFTAGTKLQPNCFFEIFHSYEKDDLHDPNLQFLFLRLCSPFRLTPHDVEKAFNDRGVRLLLVSPEAARRQKELLAMDAEDSERERALQRIEEIQQTNSQYYEKFKSGEQKAAQALEAIRARNKAAQKIAGLATAPQPRGLGKFGRTITLAKLNVLSKAQ